jgi:dihydroorotate dehydrogenase
LSGAPLKKYTLTALKTLRSHLPASIPLIGCGGIFTGADALEYGKAGACLVQIYTSFGYDGVGTCRRIKDELSELLAKDGTTWESVVNQAVNELSFKQPEKQAAEGSISLLIEEAKELGKLLDEFGETFGKESSKEITAIPPTAS